MLRQKDGMDICKETWMVRQKDVMSPCVGI